MVKWICCINVSIEIHVKQLNMVTMIPCIYKERNLCLGGGTALHWWKPSALASLLVTSSLVFALVSVICWPFFFLCVQVLTFYFPDCGKLAPPVVQVQTMSFSYGPEKVTSQNAKSGGNTFESINIANERKLRNVLDLESCRDWY